MDYKERYRRLLNVSDPVRDQFRSGIEFQYFFFPKSIKGGEATREERRNSEEHFFEAVVYALRNRMLICGSNLYRYTGKSIFAPVLFKIVRDKLPRNRKKDLLLFCAYGTAFDLWNRSDLFFVLNNSVVRIDLTLNQFRDKPKEYNAKTYVFTRYHLVGSSLGQIASYIALSLKEGDYVIHNDLVSRVYSLVNRWKTIFDESEKEPDIEDRLVLYKEKNLK